MNDERRRELLLRKRELLLRKKQLLEAGAGQEQTTAQPEKTVGGVFGKVTESEYAQGKRNILGNIFERPGAAVRSAILNIGPTGKSPIAAYKEASINPTNIPTFQDLALEKSGDAAIKEAIKSGRTPSTAEFFAKGLVPSTAGLVAGIATNPADVLTLIAGKAPTGGGTTLGGRIASTKAGQAVGRFMTVRRSLLKPFPKDTMQYMDEAFIKAVRPSVVGKRTRSQVLKYKKETRVAVDTILSNKKNLRFMDEGGQVVNRLPESLDDLSSAIQQTKTQVYSLIDDLTQAATERGAQIPVNKVVSNLEKAVQNRALQIAHPEMTNYIGKRIESFKSAGSLTAKEADDVIKHLNNSLKSYYSNPTPQSYSQATIDSGIVNILRQELDDLVMQSTGETIKPLKMRYGALKAIERDVNRRAIVHARQNIKGLVDFTDIFSGGQMAAGILSGNPAQIVQAATQKGIAAWIKRLNDPDRIVKLLFKRVETPLGKVSESAVSRTRLAIPSLVGTRQSVERPAMKY